MCFGSGGGDKGGGGTVNNLPKTTGGPAEARRPPDPMASSKAESGLLTESVIKPRPSVLGAQ